MTHRQIHSAPVRRLQRLAGLTVLAACAGLAACVAYPAPYGYPAPVPAVASFDRSWDAAVGAMLDNGLTITGQDRNTGVVSGRRGGIDIVGSVRNQPDGTVRVEFNSSGATAQDPGLIGRVSTSYERRMGR